MSESIQVRQENPEEEEKMAKLQHPDTDVYGYVSREVADQLGEYMELTISEDEGQMAELDGVTGSGSGNYATFDTPGGAIVGLGIHNDVWSDVFDREVERDEDNNVTNAPESVGLQFAPSTEEDYESAEEVDEEEIEALVAGSGESETETQEEEVEISDEELNLVADE